MFVNGLAGLHDTTASPSGSVSPILTNFQTQAGIRLSLDDERSGSSSPTVEPSGVNGHRPVNGKNYDEGLEGDPISQLQKELEATREEKERLAAQYQNLLGKLTTMRTTLGNKLKQDAEELDRREQLVQQLTVQNEDLSSTIETLKDELIASHEETNRMSIELDNMRNRALHENAQESLLRERELQETQAELEQCKMERDEWERASMQDKVIADETKSALESYKRDLELEHDARLRHTQELELEREKSINLQSVLQDFQSAKDHELQQAVKDYNTQLTQATQSLAEYKHRAITAELQLEELLTNSLHTHELEKEVKEKNLLIGKLRHETVIMNEHLMEALRRLRRNSSDSNVDRRLVTNVLLSFLATPRADPKRFEMLSLLATILSWSDPEREKAGLQRAHQSPPSGSLSFWSRSSTSSPTKNKSDPEKTDETESFSRLWVEFLLTEAASGESTVSTPTRANTSLPGSPHGQSFPTLGSGSPPPSARRLSSFSTLAMTSSPNLTLGFPPSRKGKEKDVNP